MLGIQVRIGGMYFSSVETAGSKPLGGLWTASKLDNEMGSSWTEWCEKEDFNLPEDGIWKAYLLQPNDDARIYSIDSIEDYNTLLDKYNFYDNIDYEEASKDYDAIHLTWDGIWATHDVMYGWDLESTVWLNEAYTVIEEIEWPVVDRTYSYSNDKARVDIIKDVDLKKGDGRVYRWKYKNTPYRALTHKLYVLRFDHEVFACLKVCIDNSKCTTALEAMEQQLPYIKEYWGRDELLSMLAHAMMEDM